MAAIRERNRYVHGSVAAKPDIRRELEREPRKRLSNTTRKNREKAWHMSPGYVFFVSIGMIAMGWILIN